MQKSLDSNLKSVIKKGENHKTEFKESVTLHLDRQIVAFANASGGNIYIGITDDGKVKGVKVTNKLKSQIQDIAKNCDPKISISIKEIKKFKILVVSVKASHNKPHKCSSGFYIRSGASTQKLTRDEIREFMASEDVLSFDRVLCKKFDYKKHFDKDKLFSFLDKAGITYTKKNYLQILENLEVIQRLGNKVLFNNAGALFFAKDSERIFLHAEISCALFKGTDKVYVLDRKRFNKDLLTSVDDAILFLEKHLRLEYRIIPGRVQRKEILEIPSNALREALINAVTHRDYLHQGVCVHVEIYDDRVEISNFGGLPKGLDKKNFGTKSVLRNPLIAHLMLRAGYIERMGTGIKKMRTLVKKAGLPPIKFKLDNFVTVTFSRPPIS